MSTTRLALGARGERLAAQHLTAGGCQVLERNFRTSRGELDLVVRDRDCIAFCEVKTRVAWSVRGPPGPLDAIGPGKRRRLRLMAREWLSAQAASEGIQSSSRLRFDAIGVTLDDRGAAVAIEHVRDAF